MPATSVIGRPSIKSSGALPSGFSARNEASRVSLRAKDTGRGA